ncbi:DUF1559 domain-containing protein [Novipirellula sp. SH528]|uniref:DUF1559 domain-containing protein n=1 Tax=Novipirellula sp. SH528 TaxID=3454466 RepID=UPI003FA0C98F
MSNENPYSEPQQPQQPYHQPPGKSDGKSTMVIVGVVLAVALAVMLVCGGILVALMLPAVQAAREAARRMQCSNNIKQIGLALHNYHSAYNTLPPAYTVDANGRPMHSWRSIILPFMEQQGLHERIDFSKPWDAPENLAVAQTVVPQYSCPSSVVDPTMTTYVAVVHPQGIMSGATPTKFRQVVDGLSNTLMVVEADTGNAVNWMSPDDIDLQAFLASGTARDHGGHIGGAHVLMGDGAVQFVTDSMDQNLRKALVTKDGNEDLSAGF